WMQGRRDDAIKAADVVAEAMAPMAEMIPDMTDAFTAQPIFARVYTLAWDQMLKIPQPGEKMVVSRALWNYGRALAFLARRNKESAAEERSAFEAARAKVPAARGWGFSKASDILTIAAEVLAARSSATPEQELSHWRKAVEVQESLSYDEPPEWYYLTRE